MGSSYNSSTTKPIYRGTQIIWYVLGFVEVMLALRFALKLLGSNPEAGFIGFVYGATTFLVAPFFESFLAPPKCWALFLSGLRFWQCWFIGFLL